MVQTEISQLAAESTDWRQILRNYREEFHNCEKALTDICKQSLSKDQLAQVEHFQNQFDIQLRNIHDLKQDIKSHERKVQLETSGEEIYAEHERLLGEFVSLEKILQQRREKFQSFISTIRS